MLDKKYLKECIENANYMMIGYCDEAKPLQIGSIRGHITPTPSEWTNFVNVQPVNQAVTNEQIDEVVALFKKEKKNFTWLLGDDNDSRLELQLIDKGFVEMEQADGLVFDLSKTIHEVAADVVIRLVDETDYYHIKDLGVNAYGLTKEVADFYYSFCQPNQIPSILTYYAFSQNSDKPISYGMMIDIPDSTVVLLSGAGTMPDYRGQGIYKALLAARLLAAKQCGKTAAITQGIASTSSPICQRYGFEKIYQQRLFTKKV